MKIVFPVKLFYDGQNNLKLVRIQQSNCWGVPFYIFDLAEISPKDNRIHWYSEYENKVYEIYFSNLNLKMSSLSDLVLGIFPYGRILIWEVIENVTRLIWSGEGKVCSNVGNVCLSKVSKENKEDERKRQNERIESHLCTFCYRYIIKLKTNIVLDYFAEILFDATNNCMNDGSLLKYHEAGKPKKLRVQWHIGKSEYSAYFWFEDERIREVFDKFYGAHPDTKTDFIIRIDAEKRKYELALYRYGLKEPQIIPEDVYQLLVFKNKFEDYRSENYNQERGAWIW